MAPRGRGRAIRRFASLAARTRGRVGLSLAVAALGGMTLAPGCGHAPSERGVPVDVQLRDFRIRVSRHSVPAGKITFRVHNDGPSTHEFAVDRTALAPAGLPIAKDGMSIDEESPGLTRVSSLEEVFDGHSDDLTLTLARGHYVVYCNMEGHYLGDMRASVDVR